MKQILYRNCY